MTNNLWYGDNLNIMRSMRGESVDLIYLDPPYNSKRDHNCTFGAVAQSKAFEDTWKWDKNDEEHLDWLEEHRPSVGKFLVALGSLLPKRGLYPYLVNMAIRLVEMHRLLKPTGSIYLHVDPTASHYLKLVMDQIFGGQNFQNEIIWSYKRWPSKQTRYQRMHDVILFYSKSNEWTWNQQFDGLSESTRKAFKGKAQVLKAGATKKVTGDQESQGMPMRDVWEIPFIAGASSERLGYPTQKPLALLERIIKASSNEGDVVLDPYMGSGTTIEAAAKHGRQWIGIDVTHHAVATTANRLRDCGLPLRSDQIIGVPEDIASARQLKTDNPRQFDAWCVLQCEAMPQDDGERIVGLRQFPSISKGNEHLRRALYMATHDDPPTMEDLKGCVAKMRKYGCELGFLYCFEMPNDPAVLHFLQNQGQFHDDLRSIPSLQLITMRDLLHGNSAANLTSEWRQRRLRDLSNQLELV
jgi:DNA modification methylase